MYLMNQDHGVELETNQGDTQLEMSSSTHHSTLHLQHQHNPQWSTTMSMDSNTNVALSGPDVPRTTAWAPRDANYDHCPAPSPASTASPDSSGVEEYPRAAQFHTRRSISSSSGIFLEQTIDASASPQYDTNSMQLSQPPVTHSSGQESESLLEAQSEAMAISNEDKGDERSSPGFVKDVPLSDRAIKGSDKFLFGDADESSSAFTFLNRPTRPISWRATRSSATLRPIMQKPPPADMPQIIHSPDSSQPNSPTGETGMPSTSSTTTASQTLVEMIQTMPSSGLLDAVNQDLREKYLVSSQEIGEITNHFDLEKYLPRDGLSMYTPLPKQGLPPNHRETRHFKRLPTRERYIYPDVRLKTRESDSPAVTGKVDANRPRQRPRYSPPENVSFDATKYEGGNFGRNLNCSPPHCILDDGPTRRIKPLPPRKRYIYPDVRLLKTRDNDDLHADIENYLAAVDGALTEGDLATITEFMEMHLPNASTVYQQLEQHALTQANYLERDTVEEFSEVSLGSSEGDNTYWHPSFQDSEDSNLYLPGDMATGGDLPVTYTWVQSGSNSEYSILGEPEYSQQRPNHLSSGPTSMYSSLSGVFGNTEPFSQRHEELTSIAEPNGASSSVNPDHADYQPFPTSSNSISSSSSNGGHYYTNNGYRDNTLFGNPTGAVSDPPHGPHLEAALSLLSLSETDSGQNWTPPPFANPDVSHPTVDARETEVAQRSDDLSSETQVLNEEVENGHVSPSQALAGPLPGASAIASDGTVTNLNTSPFVEDNHTERLPSTPPVPSRLESTNDLATGSLANDNNTSETPTSAPKPHAAEAQFEDSVDYGSNEDAEGDTEREDESTPRKQDQLIDQKDSEDEDDMEEVHIPLGEPKPAVSEAEVNDLRNEVARDLPNTVAASEYMDFSSTDNTITASEIIVPVTTSETVLMIDGPNDSEATMAEDSVTQYNPGMGPAADSEVFQTMDDPNEAAMAENMIGTVTNHNAATVPVTNYEVLLTVDDPSEVAMAEDMLDTVTDHHIEVDLTATQVLPMVEHTPLLSVAMDTEIIAGSSEESATSEDWSMDLALTRTSDDRPSRFLVPYTWLLPSAMRVSRGLTDDDDLDSTNQPMVEADGDEEPSRTDDLITPTQGTFMDVPTRDVTLGISRLSIIENAPAVVSSEMSVFSTGAFDSAHDSVNADLDTVPFENFNPTHNNELEATEQGVVQSSNLESDSEMQHEQIAHCFSEDALGAAQVLPAEPSTTQADIESLTPVPDFGGAVGGVHTLPETTPPSNVLDDELENVARGVPQGQDLCDNQQAWFEEEIAIIPGDIQQVGGAPLDLLFPTLGSEVVWSIDTKIPIGIASEWISTIDADAGRPEDSICSIGSPITGPLTTWVEEVLESLETRSGVASNDGQRHIPAVNIWSRRQPHLIQGDIPEVICELYGEGIVVQARRTRGFPHPYRSDGRIHKSFYERRRRITVCQAARTGGRPEIDSDEKTMKYNTSDNDSNSIGVSDGVVGNMTADVRLGEVFEPPHAVDDVANFKSDVFVDEKGSKNPKRVDVNVKSHLRAKHQESSIATSYSLPAAAPGSSVAVPDCSASSAIAPVVLLDVAPVPVPVPLLVAPVIVPLEEPLSMAGAWPDPILMYGPPGQAPRWSLWDIFADWFVDSWEALFGVVIERN